MLEVPHYMKKIINDYYKDDAKKLCGMVDKALKKLKFDPSQSDFYSLASEIFVRIIQDGNYNPEKNFDNFFYSCLLKKFKTEMTRLGRYKRTTDKMAIPLDTPTDVDGKVTIEDTISDVKTVESVYFGEVEKYSPKMKQYLSRLSPLQRRVLKMQSIGYKPTEVIGELKLTQKQYEDCKQAIHSYCNTKILM